MSDLKEPEQQPVSTKFVELTELTSPDVNLRGSEVDDGVDALIQRCIFEDLHGGSTASILRPRYFAIGIYLPTNDEHIIRYVTSYFESGMRRLGCRMISQRQLFGSRFITLFGKTEEPVTHKQLKEIIEKLDVKKFLSKFSFDMAAAQVKKIARIVVAAHLVLGILPIQHNATPTIGTMPPSVAARVWSGVLSAENAEDAKKIIEGAEELILLVPSQRKRKKKRQAKH